MTQITHFNKYSTKGGSRIVATYSTDADERDALAEAASIARNWNATEERDDMRVNFILAGTSLRAVG